MTADNSVSADMGAARPGSEASAPSAAHLVRYATIVADPPWDYPEGFATQSRTPGKWAGPVTLKPLPYPSLDLGQIEALPVGSLAAKHCRLFLWTTNRYLPASFAVLSAWGFTYRQTLVWSKRDGNMGGSVAASSAEFLLVATQGTPTRLGRWPTAVIETAAPKRHSSKPEVFLDLIEHVSPEPRLEMFARRTRLGWDTWGDEALQHVEIAS